MESYCFSLRGFIYSLLIASILFVQGCSKDEDNLPSIGNDGKTVTKTIGSSGGEIGLEGYRILIPPGAFSQDQTIKVSTSDDQHPFREQEVTPLYQIKGIPKDFTGSISIKMKYDGMLENETFIANGVEWDLEEPDTTVIYFDLLECKDSSGYLVGKLLPAGPNTGTKAKSYNIPGQQTGISELLHRYQKGITSYKPKTIKTTDPPFLVVYPTSFEMDPRITNLPDYLEINYLIFETWMEPTSFKGFRIPQNVIVFDRRHMFTYFNRVTSFEYVDWSKSLADESIFQYNIYNIDFNERKFCTDMGRAFYKSFQSYIYEGHPRKDWFSDATAVWIEEKFFSPLGTVENYVPDALRGKEMHPFGSWEAKLPGGLAPLVKHLVEEYGEEIIIKYHEKLKDDRDQSVNKILGEVIGDPPENWLPEFFIKYLEGKIYNVSGDLFVKGVDANYNDLPLEGTNQSITDKYTDLSAKLYRFNTESLVFINQNNSAAKFKVESSQIDSKKYLAVLVFTLDRETNKIECITDEVSNLVMVSDLKSPHEQNKDLLVLAVNSFRDISGTVGNPEVQLSVELKVMRPLTYKRFSVSLRKVDVEYTRKDDQIITLYNTNLVIRMPDGEEGEFTDGEFEAQWDVKNQYSDIQGYVNASVTQGWEPALTSLDFKQVVVRPKSEDVRHMTVFNIPLIERGLYEHYGKVTNANEIAEKIHVEEWSVMLFNDDKTTRNDSYWLTKIHFIEDKSELEVNFTDPN